MGRHRKRSSSTLRRNTVIALTGLIPAGAITVASGYGASADIPFLRTHTTASESALEPTDVAPAVDVAPAPTTQSAPEPVAPPAPEPAPAPALPESLAAGPLGVPGINVAAYKSAETLLAQTTPGCSMNWALLAGVGRVESTHANDGKAGADGTLFEPILGPVLDGSLAGNNVIMDTDGGELDGNATYDRAVGPMQFLPATWKHYATDGNGDGRADPQNLFDSAATTGKYLCDGGLNMADPIQATQAILRYNNSMAYVANVVAWSVAYSTGIAPSEADLPRIH
ncbi:lytic murein transglycosylase [Rhodococcus sp. BP-316]|uniref:lytic transglycosylase domain-containing protein n=1 Tax=Rhodococcus sp. BP-316 TaxID=2739445 RepID=UPI001C9B5ED4|nr:lytic murein transglycosylase [Rhodococcus sp. BP-316]MBY6680724.1 lytic murein transglycosylase [Rhodococcus sp. BP-316]